MTQFELEVLQACATYPFPFNVGYVSSRGQSLFGSAWCQFDAQGIGVEMRYSRRVALAMGKLARIGLLYRMSTNSYAMLSGGSFGIWHITDAGKQLINSLETSS